AASTWQSVPSATRAGASHWNVTVAQLEFILLGCRIRRFLSSVQGLPAGCHSRCAPPEATLSTLRASNPAWPKRSARTLAIGPGSYGSKRGAPLGFGNFTTFVLTWPSRNAKSAPALCSRQSPLTPPGGSAESTIHNWSRRLNSGAAPKTAIVDLKTL